MSDLKSGDHAEPAKASPEAHAVKTADAQEARNASGGDMAVVGNARTNASDGSLRKYGSQSRAEQEASIELISGDKVVSRQTALTEKDLEAKPQAKTILEELSRTASELHVEAKQNPVLEPVAQLRKYADSLPSGDEKDMLIKLSREQAKEISPEMKARLEKREKLGEVITKAGLDQAASFNLAELKAEASPSDRVKPAGREAASGPQIEVEAQHVAQLIKAHDYIGAQKAAQNELMKIEKSLLTKPEKAALEEKFLMSVAGEDKLSFLFWPPDAKHIKFELVEGKHHIQLDLVHTALGENRKFYQDPNIHVMGPIKHDIEAQPAYKVPHGLNTGQIKEKLQVLAEKMLPDGTPEEIRQYMQEIRGANGIRPGDDIKDGQTLTLPGHRTNGDVIIVKGDVTTTSNHDQHYLQTENSKTGELQRHEVDALGNHIYLHKTRDQEDERITVRLDGSAVIQEAGQPPRELSAIEAAKNPDVQRARLEAAAVEKIADPNELKQFLSDVKKFVDRYPPEFMHISAEDANIEKARALAQIDKLVEAGESKLPAPQEFNRLQVAEQLMHHIADPTTVDQGPFPVCQFESLQDRQMLRNPAEAARLVVDVALTGEYAPTDGKMMAAIKLDPTMLIPDENSKEYRIDKGDAARRSYASQLYDAVTYNLALSVTEGDPKRAEYSHVHLESKNDKYFIVQNDKKSRVEPLELNKFAQNMQPSIESLVRVNAAIVGKAEAGFIIVGGAWGDKSQQQYGDMIALGDGIHHLHAASEFPGMLQSIKDSGEWPPILSMESSVDPIKSQWHKAHFAGNVNAGGHSEILTDFDATTHMGALDGHWGKAADQTGTPSVNLDVIANAILKRAETPGKGFVEYCKYLNDHPDEIQKLKQALAELVHWRETHPDDAENQYKLWRSKNNNNAFKFINDWIVKHWTEDHSLTFLVKDVQDWLKHYPPKKS